MERKTYHMKSNILLQYIGKNYSTMQKGTIIALQGVTTHVGHIITVLYNRELFPTNIGIFGIILDDHLQATNTKYGLSDRSVWVKYNPETGLTRRDMIKALRAGCKVNHNTFSSNEYFCYKDGAVQDENGYFWGGLHCEGLEIRKGGIWERNWKIVTN